MNRILITDDVHPILRTGLEDLDCTIDYEPNVLRTEVLRRIGDYEGIVVNSRMYMDREMMTMGENLKFIARLGSGLDIIDLPFARERNITVLNSPTGNCDAVAEHVMGMILSFANNLISSDEEVRNEIWKREKNRGWELGGKTIGIIGFGHTGSAVAKRLAGWNVKVLAYDKYKTEYASEMDYVKETDLQEVVEGSDIITLHVPLTDETHHMVSTSFLSACKSGCLLVNASRGKVVDTKALLNALDQKILIGACLDVFENEKPKTWSKKEREMYHLLYERGNVIVSPHIAGWTYESKKKLSEVLLTKISRAI